MRILAAGAPVAAARGPGDRPLGGGRRGDRGLPATVFDGVLPAVRSAWPRETTWFTPGETLRSVGCANGTWATGWTGHALGYDDDGLRFVPAPANGRSGSAIFDAEQRTDRGPASRPHAATTPKALPRRSPRSTGPSPPRPKPCRPRPVRKCCSRRNAGPTAAGRGPAAPNGFHASRKTAARTRPLPHAARRAAADLKPLDDKLAKIADLLSEMKARAGATGSAGAGVPLALPVPVWAQPAEAADPQARKAAQEALQTAGQAIDTARGAQAETAKLAQLTEGLAANVKQVAEQANKLGAAREDQRGHPETRHAGRTVRAAQAAGGREGG